MNSGKVLLGVLAGVAVGALLGVLLAPEKGSVLRQKITDKGEDYVGEVKNKFNELLDTITGRLETLKAEGIDLMKKSKSRLENAKEDMVNSSR